MTTDHESRLDLRALVDDYAWRADERDREGFADLFVPDGMVSSTNPGETEPFYVARGRSQLLTVLDGNDQFARTFHSVTNHRCTVSDDQAAGVTYCTAHHLLVDSPTTEALVMLIRYHDDYRRDAGRWRFVRRGIEMVWVEYVDSDSSPYPFRKGSADWMD